MCQDCKCPDFPAGKCPDCDFVVCALCEPYHTVKHLNEEERKRHVDPVGNPACKRCGRTNLELRPCQECSFCCKKEQLNSSCSH